MKLIGHQYYLRPLYAGDVTRRYVAWLNDPQVNRFMTTRKTDTTRDSVTAYVRSFDMRSRFLFGIFPRDSQLHIGNIALNGKADDRAADFGFMIGDKAYWGKQAATGAIVLLINFAFDNLGLMKLWGGSCDRNIWSVRKFEALGFRVDPELDRSLNAQQGHFYAINRPAWQKQLAARPDLMVLAGRET